GSRSRIERYRADPLAGDVRDEEDGAHLRGRGDAEPAHDPEARNPLVLDRRDQPDVRLARSELVRADGWNVPRDDDAGGRLVEKAPDQGPRVQVVDDGEAQGVTTPATSGSGTPRSFWSSRSFRSGAPLPRRSRSGSAPCVAPRLGSAPPCPSGALPSSCPTCSDRWPGRRAC